MGLKTDFMFNEDDFVQRDEKLHELTVTITLYEYRNLIRDLQKQDIIIENLQEEFKKYKESTKTMFQFLMIKSPEVINKSVEVLRELFPQSKEKSDEEETEKEETTEQ